MGGCGDEIAGGQSPPERPGAGVPSHGLLREESCDGSAASAMTGNVIGVRRLGSGASSHILLVFSDSNCQVLGMLRTLRHQYAGAVYHVMARGDGGKSIFETDDDGKAFLFRLGQVCASHGWRVHAWVLMNNHFHLLLETPEPNLVTGMKYLLGTFSQGWNARRSRRGHVFQGRYKAVPVSAAVESPYYFPDRGGLHPSKSRKSWFSGRQARCAAVLQKE